MRARTITVWFGALLLAASAAAVLAAQTYTPPKTPWGDPDLQGIWPSTAMVGVPFERPAQYGNRLYLTEDEFKQRQKDAEHQSELDNESFSVDNVKQDVVAMGDVAAAVLARARRAVAPVIADRRSAGRPPAADDAGRPATRGDDEEHVPAVHGIQRGVGARTVRSVYFSRRPRLDVPGYLQQRQPVHPDSRVRRP